MHEFIVEDLLVNEVVDDAGWEVLFLLGAGREDHAFGVGEGQVLVVDAFSQGGALGVFASDFGPVLEEFVVLGLEADGGGDEVVKVAGFDVGVLFAAGAFGDDFLF